MAESTRYLMAKSAEDEQAIVNHVASQMQNGETKLVDLVQSIGPYITDDDLVQQAKAIQYISAVLAQLSPDLLPRQDVALMVQFFSSRLQIPNVPGVRETAHGLRVLSDMTRFNSSEASDIAAGIFGNRFDFPTQVAATRLQVYKLLHSLIQKHRKSLQSMKGEFVDGFLILSARETDPRNLMICFSILPIVMTEFEYNDEQNTNLWDASCRYFPITFRPKPNDPIGITADDLKLKLRGCISASSSFAPLAFPFLIQKLDDQTIANVKKDVMRTIAACAESYDPSTLSLWSFQIWEALKYEVLSATDDDLAEDALVALSAISKRLSYQITMQTLEDTPLHRYISLLITDCNGYLREPEQRHAKQAGQILGRISGSSPLAFHLVVKGILPPLLTVYHGIDALSKKRCLLEVVNGVLDSRLSLQPSKFEQAGIDGSNSEVLDDTIESGGLHHFRDNLIEIFTIALTRTVRQESKFRQTALQGLLKLARIPQYLTNPEIGMICQNLTEEVLEQSEPNKDVRDDAISGLQQIASKHVQQVADTAFPALLATLPDSLADSDNGETHLNTLGALGKMSAGADLFQTFSLRLLNKLDAVLNSGRSLEYGKIILTGLLFGVKQHEILRPVSADLSAQQEDHLGASIVERLLRKVTEVGVTADGPQQGTEFIGLKPLSVHGDALYADDDMLDLIGKIAMVVVRSMPTRQQLAWLVPNICKLSSKIDTQNSSSPTQAWLDDSSDAPLWLLGSSKSSIPSKTKIKTSHCSVAILSMYMLAGLQKELGLAFSSSSVCLSSLICLVNNTGMSVKARKAMQNYAALLVNKHRASTAGTAHDAFPNLKDYIEDLVKSVLDNGQDMPSAELHRKLQVVYSFIMAANLAVDRCTTALLTTLLGALENPRTGHSFALYFQELLAPSEILCPENHAVIRQISKQRLFGTCVPTIVQSFKATTDLSVKANYLVALAGILKHTPTEIVLPQIETLLPLLLQSLELKAIGDDDNVKGASIECLGIAITQSSSAAEGHAKSIIGILTKTWHNTREKRSSSSADLRAKALSCMTLIPGKLRDTITLPFKQSVLRDLEAGAVGDPKRRVRTEAVDCRAAWSNLAEPTVDDD